MSSGQEIKRPEVSHARTVRAAVRAVGGTMSEGFDFSAFGEVQEVKTVTNKTVEIPADRRAAFARAAYQFSVEPNTTKVSLNMATEADAIEWRAQIETFAREENLNAYLPKWRGEHAVDRTDKDTGKVTTKIVPDNGVPKHFNVGRNVTFRFSARKGD